MFPSVGGEWSDILIQLSYFVRIVLITMQTIFWLY